MLKHTMPTPYLVGEVHFYSTQIDGEAVLFDTGPATPEAWELLPRLIDLSRLKHVFITHCHVDHYGLARFIEEQSDAQIYIPRKDAIKILHHEKRLGHIEGMLREMGFENEPIRQFRESVERNRIFPGPPVRYRIVEESEVPARLEIGVLSCPGHSQSDLVYLLNNRAVTGDVLLRNIFQAPLLDVDLETFEGRFRNYEAYCSTLLTLQKLQRCVILPGHRDTVSSLNETILFYVNKILERSLHLTDFSRNVPVRHLIRKLFGDAFADPFIMYLKASEIVFMQDFLANPDILEDSLKEIGLFEKVRADFERVVRRVR